MYLLWQTPELFYLGLVARGLFAWRRGRPLARGRAARRGRVRRSPRTPRSRSRSCSSRSSRPSGSRDATSGAGSSKPRAAAVVVTAVFASGFALNWPRDGRGQLPGRRAQDVLRPLPLRPGRDLRLRRRVDDDRPRRAARRRPRRGRRAAGSRRRGRAAELRQSFVLNLLFFWIGRFAGALPYFPGFGCRRAAVPAPRPARARRLAGAGSRSSCRGSGYILIIPDNWYGGGGHDRQPLLPERACRSRCCCCRAGRGRLGSARRRCRSPARCSGRSLASPVRHSLNPGAHALAPAFRVLPAELTMLGDLSVFTDVWRKRRPYNLPGGDPARRAPGDPPRVLPVVPRRRHVRPGVVVRRGGLLAARGRGRRGRAAVVRPARSSCGCASRRGPRGTSSRVRLGRDRAAAGAAAAQDAARSSSRLASAPVGYYGTQLYPLRLGVALGAATDAGPAQARLVRAHRARGTAADMAAGARRARRPAPFAAARRGRG